MGMPNAAANINKINYFDVHPKIVMAGCKTTISVSTKYISKYPQFTLSGLYFVMISPILDFDISATNFQDLKPQLIEAVEGKLHGEYNIETEQEYYVRIWQQDSNGENRNLILNTVIYALDDDLYNLIPLKGNTHLHSCFSDGLEDPLQHLGAALKHGYDYIALTDHNNYEGSIKAKFFLDKLNFTDINRQLTILNGEEFSCSYQPMHIISLGATQAISSNLYIKESVPEFNDSDEKLDWIIEQLTKLCDEIHKYNGVVVLCHPYWKPIYDFVRLDAPYRLIKRFLETGLVDAFEVVGGSPKHQNIVSQQQHLLALESLSLCSHKYAFLGQSDSHVVNDEDESCIFPYKYTIAFCKDNSRESIIDCIKNDRTVAVEETDGKCEYFGSLRLVNLCRFLEKEYFPRAKEVKKLYYQVFEMCATGALEDGKTLSDALGKVKLFEYGDLK